ncbi:hypothetical protein LINPERPRIM_LOCUS22758 [Linum perenne]
MRCFSSRQVLLVSYLPSCFCLCLKMPFEIMTGDCPKCGNVNFSIGTFCDTGKCNTPTPESQILCSCNCKLHNLAKIQVFFN